MKTFELWVTRDSHSDQVDAWLKSGEPCFGEFGRWKWRNGFLFTFCARAFTRITEIKVSRGRRAKKLLRFTVEEVQE